ncbi:MAG: hypothetical protein ACK5HR_06500 [Mycoplasmatales bacterium]
MADELEYMSYESLKYIRKTHPARRILTAINSSFIISFLYKQFTFNNVRQVSESILIGELEYVLEVEKTELESKKR